MWAEKDERIDELEHFIWEMHGRLFAERKRIDMEMKVILTILQGSQMYGPAVKSLLAKMQEEENR